MFKQNYIRDVARLTYDELLNEVVEEISFKEKPSKEELVKEFLKIRKSNPNNHRYFYKKYAERFEVTDEEVEIRLGITKEEREMLTRKGILTMRRKRIDLNIVFYDFYYLTILKEAKLNELKRKLRQKGA